MDFTVVQDGSFFIDLRLVRLVDSNRVDNSETPFGGGGDRTQ